MKIQETVASLPAKTVRLSVVAFAAAVMAVIWAIVDEISMGGANPVIVSSITSLVMLIAQFIDVRAKAGGADVYEGQE